MNDEWRRYHNDLEAPEGVHTAAQETREEVLHDCGRGAVPGNQRFLARSILHQLDREHSAHAAHVAYDGVLLFERAQCVAQPGFDLIRSFEKMFIAIGA